MVVSESSCFEQTVKKKARIISCHPLSDHHQEVPEDYGIILQRMQAYHHSFQHQEQQTILHAQSVWKHTRKVKR